MTKSFKESKKAGEGSSHSKMDGHLVSFLDPASFEAERYRLLRHKVEQMHQRAGLSIVAVSSPAVGDGKTTTAINLAGALAQASEARVLLVDMDLRRPSVALKLGMDGSSGLGLVDAIQDPTLDLEKVVSRHPSFNLSLLLPGRSPEAPYELLKSARLGELLEEARRNYNYVVLDTPPLVPVPDCQIFASRVDGFLVVVAAHRTPRKLLEEALNALEPAKVLGLVFNGDDHPLSGRYGYYYAYVRPPKTGRTGLWGRLTKKMAGAFYSQRSSQFA